MTKGWEQWEEAQDNESKKESEIASPLIFCRPSTGCRKRMSSCFDFLHPFFSGVP